ncbi:hypothetical protein [Evansella cellulosilytica]|uniref:Uncharacterized protein n=1 Tax=Evansella cellulosilytica (strain ATCC 21833 / DSM 2522 / FERM P-1141 / JCM 9156 / N-4) TaxID=649639 RepID=E6U1B9_EVAC2|nr:hypothetical protein [Evansella cellulosilytica]ADU29166.1 hypothetical protein Bcell_0890 [Evansella cellulosilytica DSM 2522]
MEVKEKIVNEIGLTEEEYEMFVTFKFNLSRAVSSSDAKYYKDKLEMLAAKGRERLLKS